MSSDLFSGKALREIRQGVRRWQQQTLKGRLSPEHSESGIPIELVYTPEDVADINYFADLGLPGEAPFVRGIYPDMYRGRLFTVRQIAGFGTPEDCNKRIKFLLDHGATGVNIVFDLPTVRGYDSDDPRAEGNCGQCGVSIDSVRDLEALFDEIPIDKISVSLVTHLPSVTVALLAMYTVMAERRGISLADLAGTTQNDFLMETTIGSAPEILPPQHSFRLQCDVVEFCSRNLPRWNSISFNGYNLREAGSDAVTEVGVAIANARATATELNRRGLPIDSFAPRLSFFWDLCDDFFEEIAKCRASRFVWYKVVNEELGAQELRSMWMRFHVQTSGISLTMVEPFNNIARSAFQGLAAVLGGAQSVHIDSYDEAYSAPTEEAALLSVRTQQIIQTETGVVNTVDPLAGSYFVEYLTREMATRIMECMHNIDTRGGIVAAVTSGWLHREISDYAYRQQKALRNCQRKKVGLNYCPSDESKKPQITVFTYPETERKQKEKLVRLRQERDEKRLRAALKRLRKACDSGENVMPCAIEAARAEATLGEIEQVFREHFGLWQSPLTAF